MKNNLNIRQQSLNDFFKRLSQENRLYPTHISLLMALFYYSNSEAPEKPFYISRTKLMRFSRIKSIATYHKNIQNLVDYGYIEYRPSWHPQRGSEITLTIMEQDK